MGIAGVIPQAVAYPLTQEGVNNAYSYLISLAKGGPVVGEIVLLPGDYALTTGLPISSGISYRGTPPTWSAMADFPESGGIPTGGSRLIMPDNVDCIAYNATDRVAEIGNFASDGLYGSSLYGFTVVGGRRAVAIGAKNASGAYFFDIDQVFAYNCSAEWAFDFQNFQYCNFGSITVMNRLTTPSGGIRFRASVPSTTVLCGDSTFRGRLFTAGTGINSRGIRFSATNNGQLNDINGLGAAWQSNIYTGAAITMNVQTVNGSANLTVTGGDLTNWNYIQVGKPFVWNSTPNWLEPGAVFFINSVDQANKRFTCHPAFGTSSTVTISQTGTSQITIGSFPGLEVVTEDQLSLLTKFRTADLSGENTAGVVAVNLYRARYCDLTMSGVFAASFAEFAVNDSSGSVSAPSFALAGGGYVRCSMTASNNFKFTQSYPITSTLTGSATLTADMCGAVVVVDSASAAIVTIPLRLPQGFTCKIVQKGAGQVTIAGASGLTLLSRGSLVKTSGVGATVEIQWSSATGGHPADDSTYLLSGDLSA